MEIGRRHRHGDLIAGTDRNGEHALDNGVRLINPGVTAAAAFPDDNLVVQCPDHLAVYSDVEAGKCCMRAIFTVKQRGHGYQDVLVTSGSIKYQLSAARAAECPA